MAFLINDPRNMIPYKNDQKSMRKEDVRMCCSGTVSFRNGILLEKERVKCRCSWDVRKYLEEDGEDNV